MKNKKIKMYIIRKIVIIIIVVVIIKEGLYFKDTLCYPRAMISYPSPLLG